MASPFKVFRKNRKTMYAILTIVVILGFVIIPAILDRGKNWQTAKNPVVVHTTKYGDLKQNDLQNLRYQHDRIIRVFSSLLAKATGFPNQEWVPELEKEFGGTKDEMLVNRWLLARKAEELGINASNESIDKCLADIIDKICLNNLRFKGYEKLTDQDFTDSLRQIDRYTERMFYEDMRDTVKSHLFDLSYLQSVGTVTPGQRWDYYCRVNREATIACVPVKVENFVGEIKKPDEETLKAYFEKYKDRTPNPYSSEPGFRTPQRVDIAYFIANLEKFAVPEKITEEEIQTYYEKNANQYDVMNSNVIKSKIENEAAATKEKEEAEKKKTDKEPSGDAKSPEGDKPAETAPQTPPSEGENKDGANAKPADAVKPADNAPQPPAPEGEKKESDPKGVPAKETPADQPADKKSSSVEGSPYRFVSLQAEDEKDKPAPAAAEAPKTDAPAATADPAAKTEPAATETKPAESAVGNAPAAGEAGAKTNDPPSDITLPPEKPKGETARLLTEEVRKQIRLEVAKDKIKAIFDKIEAEMKDRAAEQRRFEANVEGTQKPANFDYERLARQYEIETGKTGAITNWEAVDLEIGKLVSIDPEKMDFAQNSRRLIELAFSNPVTRAELSKLVPVRTTTIAKDTFYLLWKTDDVKESEPKWEDAGLQERVLKAWKLEEARKLALKQAKQFADDAKKNKTSLKDVVAGMAGVETIAPPPFAWYISSGYDPRRSSYAMTRDIEKIDKPGNEFLKTVFGLEENATGTAFNEPKTIVYAIQVEKFAPPLDDLWKRFLESDSREYPSIKFDDTREAYVKLIEELKTEAGVEWLLKPDHYEKDNSPQQ
jgi:hypothetical protein